uniref:MAM domain-containing protein n=2 Tax=Astyanax mexicanus TaxID=7994 RepID=A0A3B1JCF5_ASTMX
MNTCAILLLLAVQIRADSVEGPTAGCTFDEDSDPSLCEFSQGEEDDFDWQLFRAHASPHATSDLLR